MPRCLYWIIFLAVLIALGLAIIQLPPWSGISMEQSLDAGQEEVIQRFKDRQTIPLAWQLTQNLLQKEDERFRHIDTKANAFLGMLGLALTVIATIIGVLLDKDFIIRSPQDFRFLLGFSWILTFLFLVTSFIFSLNSIQVVTDPSKGGHRDLPTNSVIGPEQVGQDPISYQKALIAEAWQVISRNRYENNRKATELLISQRIAAYAIISLLGFGLLLGVALCKERPKNPPEHHKQV